MTRIKEIESLNESCKKKCSTPFCCVGSDDVDYLLQALKETEAKLRVATEALEGISQQDWLRELHFPDFQTAAFTIMDRTRAEAREALAKIRESGE